MAGVKGVCGGSRPGSGRKSIAEEFKTSDLARTAIIQKYGSLEEGLKKLLDTGEQALIKFVFEHALGKTTDHMDVTTKGERLNSAPQEIIIKDFSKK